MRRRPASTPKSFQRNLRGYEERARRREIIMTLIRLGATHCACGCGKRCDDVLAMPDGSVLPMAFACAEIARRSAEAMPA
jgi:hypothetical protein